MSIFQLKQSLVDPVDLHGVIKIQFGRSDKKIFTYFTRLDQALILWGVAIAAVFLVAQCYWLDWFTQARLWSILSCLVLLVSSKLAWFWVTTRNQRWIVYLWSFLVLGGLGLTDYGIFAGWALVLRNLCALWLGLSAVGYVATGIGIHAQALLLTGAVHGIAILGLGLVPAHQFLLTGSVMSVSLFLLAMFHWDHR